MYFTECARLAERHPDLASVVEQVDGFLGSRGRAEVMRTEDLASFLSVDPNQLGSVLDMLAEGGFLQSEEMVECAYCCMAALRSEYEEAHDEDGEYRCTSCDAPLTNETAQTITTYRYDGKRKEVPRSKVGLGEAAVHGGSASPAPSGALLDDGGWFTHVRLAEHFQLNKGALRKRLERYRDHNQDGWKEDENRRPREPKYLYRPKDIMHIIEELRASSERPAK